MAFRYVIHYADHKSKMTGFAPTQERATSTATRIVEDLGTEVSHVQVFNGDGVHVETISIMSDGTVGHQCA